NDTLGENTASTASAQNFLQQQVDDYNKRLNDAEQKLADFKKANLGNLPTQGGPDYATRLQTAEAKQKLEDLLLKYTDEYPDVVSTRRMINQLEARRDTLRRHPGRAVAVAAPAGAGGTSRADNFSARSLAAQVAAQKREMADLKSNADKITDAQVTLQQLTRNYDVTRKQYDELVTRLNTAQLSQDATQSGNNLKFRVISPPIVPL